MIADTRDRQVWIDWLYAARKRYELCVNFQVTCNHVHLLGHDRGQGEIAQSMQLIAGREPQWSEALAVGRRSFVERVQSELGVQALHCCVEEVDGASVPRDPAPPYGQHFGAKMMALSSISTLHWDKRVARPRIDLIWSPDRPPACARSRLGLRAACMHAQAAVLESGRTTRPRTPHMWSPNRRDAGACSDCGVRISVRRVSTHRRATVMPKALRAGTRLQPAWTY
jgi:hypothetical protein